MVFLIFFLPPPPLPASFFSKLAVLNAVRDHVVIRFSPPNVFIQVPRFPVPIMMGQ